MTEDKSTCPYSDSSPGGGGGGNTFPSPPGNNNNSPGSQVRKNKRKRSEPKKRTDFSIKRFCPDSPGSACSESGRSEDVEGLQEEPPDTPEGSTNMLQDHEDSRGRSDDSDGTPPIPHGMVIYPGHFPPNFIVPSLYYKHPAAFPGAANRHIQRMDVLNNNGRNIQNSRTVIDDNNVDDDDLGSGRKTRKNYKNMTRERRIEANARERSRVHTISAAFESLRRAVPSYSYNQKLSKLAILRIASSYIMALSRLADIELNTNSIGNNNDEQLSFADCVDMCTQTIQTEGRARRRH